MKKLLAITLALGSTVACSQGINYDPNYIINEYKKCNTKPYEAVVEACNDEKENGLDNKPGCDSVNRFKALQIHDEFRAWIKPKQKDKKHCPG